MREEQELREQTIEVIPTDMAGSRRKGWVHADGYAGFNGLFRQNGADEQAYMAHTRRKFVDVHASSGSSIAAEAIERIAQLYGIEKKARGVPPDERTALRQSQAKPIFDKLQG